MQENAANYYNNGYNCSQCILKAAEAVYNIPVPSECLGMCEGVSMGFGVGEFCCCLIAGIMVFGMLFDDEEIIKRLRIKLLSDFSGCHGCMHCCKLKNERGGNYGCETLICEIAKRVEELIGEELDKR